MMNASTYKRNLFTAKCIVSFFTLFLCGWDAFSSHGLSLENGLILDLDANKGVQCVSENTVVSWENQVPHASPRIFKYTDAGRIIEGSGRPRLKVCNPGINYNHSIVFREDELINDDDTAFDGLITGKGYTWFVVIKPYKQRRGEGNYPQAFFGCLRNSAPPQNEGGQFAGFFGSFYIDGKIWMTSRNGEGEFSRNGHTTPEVIGPYLPINQWYIVAGRQGKGPPGSIVNLDLFVNNPDHPVNSREFPVSDWEPSRMAIGTERNAINHQGGESFDGELARFLVFERPLTIIEMKSVFSDLKKTYSVDSALDQLDH